MVLIVLELILSIYRDENTKEEDRRYGYVNMKDEVVVEPKFKKAWAFNEEGLAHVVTEDGKHGFINTEGEFELQPVYDFAYDFSDGLAQVTMGDKHEYIDTKGQVVLEKEGKVKGKRKKRWGSIEGNFLMPD